MYRAETVDSATQLAEQPLGGLTDLFAPFLAYFVAEQLRCGGNVTAYWSGTELAGILLVDPAEALGSLFTQRPGLEEWVARELHGIGLYVSFPTQPAGEPFSVYEGGLGPSDESWVFRHAIRPVRPEDVEELAHLVFEVDGRVNPRWFEGIPWEHEQGLRVDVAGELAGAGWVSVVGGHARLHSLAVRPRHRRLGIATDLIRARKIWARRAGARSILSEIAVTNAPSIAAAEHAGLRRIGEIYLRPPT